MILRFRGSIVVGGFRIESVPVSEEFDFIIIGAGTPLVV